MIKILPRSSISLVVAIISVTVVAAPTGGRAAITSPLIAVRAHGCGGRFGVRGWVGWWEWRKLNLEHATAVVAAAVAVVIATTTTTNIVHEGHGTVAGH